VPQPDPIDPNPSDKKPRALTEFATAEAMVQLAIALPAGCLIGGLAGAALDRHFQTGWIAVVGILLGAVAGFVQIFRTASRYMRRSG
jgi:F0F1-type ATP synthase assembly protein I